MKPQSDFSTGARRRPMSEINVVPYIDVMLVLLVVFMITAPMLAQGVHVDLPDASAPAIDVKKTEPVIVSVRRDGTYHVAIGESQEAAVPLRDIVTRVAAVKKQHPDALVLVQGDDAVPYGRVVTLMAALQKAGVGDVGLVTELPKDKTGGR